MRKLKLLMLASVVTLMNAVPLMAIAVEVTGFQAQIAAENWVRRNPRAMTASFSTSRAREHKSYKNAAGLTIYHVVSMDAGGFVVTSADTTQTPIVCFSGEGEYDPDPRNPLTSLLDGTLDPAAGVPLAFASAASAGGAVTSLATAAGEPETAAEAEWRELLDDSIVGMYKSVSSESSLTDVRVSPLVSSKWDQSGWGDYSSPKVYNYYTPNNYVCGCVATACAQIMRKWCYPTSSVSSGTYECFVDGSSVNKTMLGGTYAWSSMPLSYSAVSSPSTVQCQAIGKLTYDVGVASHMAWTSSSSGTFAAPMAKALRERFGYASANSIFLTASAGTLPSAAQNAIYSSLDAGMPVTISIKNSSGGGHEVVVDGYGYKSGTRYSHLNCGWSGSSDVWYNLMGESLTSHAYTTLDEVAYNIHPTTAGDTVSGRVLNSSGSPVSGATVTLEDASGTRRTTTTNAKGIYWFRVANSGTYQVYASSGAQSSSSRTLSITRSSNSSVTCYARYGSVTSYGSCGSQWGVDLTLQQQSTSRPDLYFVARESSWPAAVYLSSTATGRTSQNSFSVGDTIYLHVGYGNNGTAAVGSSYKVRHEILQGSTVLSSRTWDYDTVDHDQLAVGEKVWWDGLAWSGFSGLSAGTYTYRCTLDSTGVISESNESNNTATYTFTVTGGSAVSLAEALDNSSYVYSTGGSANWFGQTSTSYSGGDAAQSGSITHSQSSWFQTTVSGAGTVRFWWKVSSEANYDKLHLYVDGVSVTNISGTVGWQSVSWPVSGTGSHTIKWSYEKDGSVSSGSDCGWVDAFTWSLGTQTTTFDANGGTCATSSRTYTCGGEHTYLPRPVRSGYLFTGWFTSQSGGTEINISSIVPSSNRTLYAHWEQSSVTLAGALTSSSSSPLSFSTGGDAAWHAHRRYTYDGVAAAWNGVIGANQSSWVQTTVTGPGTLSFRWCTSCESSFDRLRFIVDGTEVRYHSTSGSSWELVSTNLTSGSHTVRWNYTKDGSVDRAWDAGWLDDVCWTPSYVTVTFDPNGGTVSPTSRTYAPGTTYGSTLPSPTRNNYTFDGWYTASSGGSRITSSSIVPSTGTTLYAHWTAIPVVLGGPYANSSLTYTYSDVPWFGQTAVTYDGNGAAQSGAISHSESSWMEATVTGSGELKFWFKTSTEANYDWLSVYIDGVCVTNVSGIVDWTQYRRQITGSGTHRVRWVYTKDVSVSSGSDACWVDKIEWGVVSDLNYGTSGGTQSSTTASLSGSHRVVCTGRPSWVTSVVLHSGGGSSTVSGSGTSTVSLSGNTYFTVTVGPNSGAARSWTMTVLTSSGDTAYTLNVSQEAAPGAPNICFAAPSDWPCEHYLATSSSSEEIEWEFEEDDDIYIYVSYQNAGRSSLSDTFVIRHEVLNSAGRVLVTWNYQNTGGLVADTSSFRVWEGSYWAGLNGLTPGDYVYRVTLDATDVIEEENENDNVSEYEFTVLPSTVTVQFDPNGGTVSPTSRSYQTGSSYATLPTPTYSGFSFQGWYTARSGGTRVTTSTIVQSSVTTLYAHWTQVAQPDLQVLSLTAKTNGTALVGAVKASTRVTLSIRVKNAGTGTAAASRAKILATSGEPARETVLGYLAVSALSANAEATYSYDVQPSVSTTYAVVADADSAVAESNESNNRSANCLVSIVEFVAPWTSSQIVSDDRVFPTIIEQISVNLDGDMAPVGSVLAAFLSGTDSLYGFATVGSDGRASFFVQAQAGRRLHFKLWSSDDGVVYDSPASADITVANPGDIFLERVVNFTSAAAFPELELSFASAGWHLMSVNQVPEGTPLADVFGEVTTKFDYLIGDTEMWSPRYGGTLTELAVGKGYWIHTTQPNFCCAVSGICDETATIELRRGWNTVGYTLGYGGMAGDVLKTAYESGKVRYVCTTERSDLFPVTLQYPMTPGIGYWVYANQDCTVSYDAEGAVAEGVMAFAGGAENPWTGVTIRSDERVFPTVFESIAVSVNGAPASKGDVLAIVGDGDDSGVWAVGEIDGNGAATLHVMSIVGRKMHFELWLADSGTEDPVICIDDMSFDVPDAMDPITGMKASFSPQQESTVITLDANGGQGGGQTVVALKGAPMPSVGTTPTRTGYAFDGYFDVRTGGVQYYTADLVSLRNWNKSDESATLYAQWTPITYSVRFDANSGEGSMDDMTGLVYGTRTALPRCEFTNGELVFAGWALTQHGTVVYRDGEGVATLAEEDGTVVTLYAVWQEVPAGFAFEECTAFAGKGGRFELVVSGGSADAATSVKVNVTYGSAKLSDLDLKNATVTGANGVEQTNLKFPLALSWRQGDTAQKTISIPVVAGKGTDAPKCLVWNLSDAKGLGVADMVYCIGTVEAGDAWDGKDVYVLPYVADATGGKVSGGASVKPDAKGNYKAATLKATANKGYWFAGWYDTDGNWACGDQSFKVTPDGSESLPTYEARFVPEQPALCGSYNGFTKVNLKGMTIVKGADTSDDVYGEYAFTAALSTAGKVSGSVTVGGKKITLKGDAVYDVGEGYATCLVTADEKALFGTVNTETLSLCLGADGMAYLCGRESTDAHAPLGGEECWGLAYKDVSKDKTATANLAMFAGTYAGAAVQADGGVVPVSIVVDANGKVKLAGKYGDGTALAASGSLGGYTDLGEDGKAAELELVMTPKALGGGAYHLSVFACKYDGGDPTLLLNGYTTTYTANRVAAAADPDSQLACPFTAGSWIPTDEDLSDPDFGAVRLTTGDDVIDILYASKNGTITGLGSALTSGYTVKFDAKTGLFTVTKGKTYTVQGVLGGYDYWCSAAGRINADGTLASVTVEYVKLPEPEESFPWEDDGFSLTLGQCFADSMQASVMSDGTPLELTITGLPSGLKYDKKTGFITGAATKAGTSTVKVSYKFGTRTITRTTSLVVADKPAELPQGTYAGVATVRIAGDELKPVDCPFTVTIDKNGSLSGSVMLFGKKATFKAAGYGYFDDGYASYEAMLDLNAVNKRWGTTAFELVFEGDSVVVGSSGSFGTGHVIVGVEALRNQSKDVGFAELAVPFAGGYIVAMDTKVDADDCDTGGVTAFSVSVDKKGTVKVAGTFADGSSISASSTLFVIDTGSGAEARALVSIAPKSLAQGVLCLDLCFAVNTDGDTGADVVEISCSATAAKYVLASGDYVSSGFEPSFAYAYSSRAWVDTSVLPSRSCLSVTCDNEAFEETTFAWATKVVVPFCPEEIVGVGKKLNGPNMTFKIDDKTGLFSGTCGTYKLFGAMREGACSGAGTVVGKDGSIGCVLVEVIDR